MKFILWTKHLMAYSPVWFTACMLAGLASHANASGFAVFTHGASALGEGLASTAHGNNPEVIFYNPALLTEIDGTQVENGVTFISPRHDYAHGLSGATADTKRDVFYPATLYFSHRYTNDVSLGLGLFSPFGLGVDWGGEWEGRYLVTAADMKTFNINPVVSYRLAPSTSVAAGIDVLLIDAALRNKLNYSALGLPDGNQKFVGNGVGYGYNLGFHHKLTTSVAFGLSYRSRIETDIEGGVRFELPDSALTPAFPNAAARTTITFPDQLHLAFAYSGIDRLILEVGARHEGWSSYKELRFDLAEPVNGNTSIVTPKQWRDTWTFTVGGRYRLNDRVQLLAGAVSGEDPIPDATYEPTVTDSRHYALTFGAEINFNKHRLAVSYAYQKWRDRIKQNDVGAEFSGGAVPDARANGRYASDSHFLAASFTYVF